MGEVNRLKRSRRGLAVYQKEREELEVMRGEQRVARSAREWWFGRSKEARGREEVKRGRLRVVVERLESVKRSLDELREEKRSLIADFQAQETEWRKHLEKKREEARKREEEERRRVAEEKAREEEEVKATAEPFLAERTLCSLLLHYCDKLPYDCEKLGGSSAPGTPPVNSLQGPNLLAVPGFTGYDRRRSSGFSLTSGASSCYATPLSWTPHMSRGSTPSGDILVVVNLSPQTCLQVLPRSLLVPSLASLQSQTSTFCLPLGARKGSGRLVVGGAAPRHSGVPWLTARRPTLSLAGWG